MYGNEDIEFPLYMNIYLFILHFLLVYLVDSGVDQLSQMSTFSAQPRVSTNDEGTCKFLETKTDVQCSIMCKKSGNCQSFKFYKDIQYCEIVEMAQSESQNDSQGNFYHKQ